MTSTSKTLFGPAPEGNPKFSFLSAVRRHKRIIAFIGATLVLGNYIVGDRLRENAKDAADDASSSATELRTQIILDNILGTVHGIDEHQIELTVEAVRMANQHGRPPRKQFRPTGWSRLSRRSMFQLEARPSIPWR